MAHDAAISVIVSTFERPGHLRRSLASLAAQEGVERRFEVIVADDGSRDGTAAMVADFARTAAIRVEFTTHPHGGFQLSKSRNDGARLASAPYLLFTDGDCVFPRDHLRKHLAAARPGALRAGERVLLDEPTSVAIGVEDIAAGRLEAMTRNAPDWKRIRWANFKEPFYRLIGHAKRPKVIGANIAVPRELFEAVNGFDEQFTSWGYEDFDFGRRVRRSGGRVLPIAHRTVCYHLWHPVHATAQGPQLSANVAAANRSTQLPRCLKGYVKRDVADVAMTATAGAAQYTLHATALAGLLPQGDQPEVEILLGADGAFQSPAACRVLVLAPGQRVPRRLKQAVHEIVSCDPTDLEAVLGEIDRLFSGDQQPATPRLAA